MNCKTQMKKTNRNEFGPTKWNECLGLMALVLISGCANVTSIHRKDKISHEDGVSVITVDAKQRHLMVVPEPYPSNENKFRICAEAAPDVFSAYASSLSANIGLGPSEQDAALANSIAETAATAERTQTVNLLRESMYRTCERYLSGALTKEQFIVQAARDQRSMVAVLAIEQLTGAVRAKPTIISGPSTSSSVIDGTGAARLIEKFSAEEDTARGNLADAEKTYSTSKKTGKCDSVANKPSADSKDPTTDAWLACKEAETLLAQRKQELKSATERLDKALTLAADFVSKTNAATTAGTNSGDVYAAGRPSDSAIIAVSSAVQNIATLTGINEPLMFCIAYLQQTVSLDEQVRDTCVGIIRNQADLDLKRQGVSIIPVDPESFARAMARGGRARAFMDSLVGRINSSDTDTLPKKISKFEERAGTKYGFVNQCASVEACRKAVIDSEIRDEFGSNEEKMQSALKDWDKP